MVPLHSNKTVIHSVGALIISFSFPRLQADFHTDTRAVQHCLWTMGSKCETRLPQSSVKKNQERNPATSGHLPSASLPSLRLSSVH